MKDPYTAAGDSEARSRCFRRPLLSPHGRPFKLQCQDLPGIPLSISQTFLPSRYWDEINLVRPWDVMAQVFLCWVPPAPSTKQLGTAANRIHDQRAESWVTRPAVTIQLRREHEYKILCTTMAIHVQSERTMETAQEAIDNALLGAPIEWPTLMQKATLPIGKQILRRAS
ncbi:hypothetical protein VTO73DRAFT_15549 [Trametes versicolor]